MAGFLCKQSPVANFSCQKAFKRLSQMKTIILNSFCQILRLCHNFDYKAEKHNISLQSEWIKKKEEL